MWKILSKFVNLSGAFANILGKCLEISGQFQAKNIIDPVLCINLYCRTPGIALFSDDFIFGRIHKGGKIGQDFGKGGGRRGENP